MKQPFNELMCNCVRFGVFGGSRGVDVSSLTFHMKYVKFMKLSMNVQALIWCHGLFNIGEINLTKSSFLIFPIF